MGDSRLPRLTWMLALLGSCTPHHADLTQCPSGSPMKGLELYSWTTPRGEWRFALVPGTNREKSAGEIRQSPCRLTLDELEHALKGLHKDAVLTWQARDEQGFSIPPSQLADRVVEAGERRGLVIILTGDSAR